MKKLLPLIAMIGCSSHMYSTEQARVYDSMAFKDRKMFNVDCVEMGGVKDATLTVETISDGYVLDISVEYRGRRSGEILRRFSKRSQVEDLTSNVQNIIGDACKYRSSDEYRKDLSRRLVRRRT